MTPTIPRLIELADRCAHLCAALRHILAADTKRSLEDIARDEVRFWTGVLVSNLEDAGREKDAREAEVYARAARLEASRANLEPAMAAERWCRELRERLRREGEEVGDHG